MNTEQERAEFEAFASSHGLCVTEDGGLYRSQLVAWMRKAWQARAALAAQACGQAQDGRPTDDALWDQTLRERDEYHDMADQLAAQIAAITGEEIGEHSSANCPWRNAMLAADDYIADKLRSLCDGNAGELDARQAFERWVEDRVGNAFTTRRPDGRYVWDTTEDDWRTWQAAWNASQASGPKGEA